MVLVIIVQYVQILNYYIIHLNLKNLKNKTIVV